MIKQKPALKKKKLKTLAGRDKPRQYKGRSKKLKANKAKTTSTPSKMPIPTEKKTVPSHLFLSKAAQKKLNKKELIAYTKKWYNYLKNQGFNDLEYLQSDGQTSRFLAKPLYEREQNKISSEDRFEYIQDNIEIQSHYRSYSYEGQFENLNDKILWFC